jgi:hypothetical protein
LIGEPKYWEASSDSYEHRIRELYNQIHDLEMSLADERANTRGLQIGITQALGIPIEQLCFFHADVTKQILKFIEKKQESLQEKIIQLTEQLSRERAEHAALMDRLIRQEVKRNETQGSEVPDNG